MTAACSGTSGRRASSSICGETTTGMMYFCSMALSWLPARSLGSKMCSSWTFRSVCVQISVLCSTLELTNPAVPAGNVIVSCGVWYRSTPLSM